MRLNPYYPGKMSMVRIDRDQTGPEPYSEAWYQATTPEERARHAGVHVFVDTPPEPRKDLSRGQAYVLGGVLQVAPEAMDLPEGARRLDPMANTRPADTRDWAHEADSWAYTSRAYQASRSDAWAEAPGLDYASHRNAAYAEAQRRASAAMQAASVRGEPTPWPIRVGWGAPDEPWSPWPATLVVLGGIFAAALGVTLIILKLMGTI